MKVTLNWISEFLDLGACSLEPAKIAELLTMSGTEVKKIEYPGLKYKNIVVGKITGFKQHPNADKLSLCRVDSGSGVLNIVCGANNFSEGDKVALALEGASTAQGLNIAKSRLRGEVSEGMMCSEYELGLTDDSEGIMILSQECTVGQSLASVLGIDDVVFELEITPNRPDCLSIAGIAREISAVADIPFKPFDYDLATEINTGSDFKIDIKDYALCPRYSAKIYKGIPQSQSPQWLKNRLMMCDYRPIDIIVDLTNYVMHETGQPLHAFDSDLLHSNKIIVRTADDGEQIITIDGNARKLSANMLVIADEKQAVAIAGVMGGKNTEINPGTKNFLLESANFFGPSIMRTSSGLGLRSEASNRFEKKIDPHLTITAIKRFDELLSKITGIQIRPGIYDNYKQQNRTRKISLKPGKIADILGESIKTETVCKILNSLGLNATSCAGDNDNKNHAIEVMVPSVRFEDLEREIDLIEEVARIYGFENFCSTPPQIMLRGGRYSFSQKTVRKIRQLLCDTGLDEVINYSFISGDWIYRTKLESYCSLSDTVAILNPINEEFAYLRTSPMPLMIKNVQNNINHDVKDIKIFEITKVYSYAGDKRLPCEKTVLGVILSGRSVIKSSHSPERMFDIYDMKAVLEMLSEKFYGNPYCIDLTDREFGFFHPALSAEMLINSKSAGFMGKIHPLTLDALDIRQDIFYMEIDLDVFTGNIESRIKFAPIPQFPSIDIDIALVMDGDVKHSDVIKEIKKSGTALLKSVRLFDIYEGPQIDEGKKSMAYALTFADQDRTLKDTEVDIIVKRIIENLSKKLGTSLRK